MTADKLRKTFCEYFVKRGHTYVPSAPLIPQKDPTLLFTNAGMVQFKGVFLGEEKKEYSRAISVQKCLRAGGKHNDLERVGYTTRHHTFFEMLGNFSFGDYFKEEAIEMGWEFLTGVLGLPADRLWVSIYEKDDETYSIWKEKIGIPEGRIVRLGEKDNFWQMGDTGPCGPCSEIIIDQGPGIGCGKDTCSVGCDCDRYLELWNLVFMQYERMIDGQLKPLPKPSIDTGMGLERLAAVCQGVKSNYESDLFRSIIRLIGEIAKVEYGKDARTDVSLRVIADHSRALCFLIADGILPSNEGRGYVLRRIIRRGARHGRLLGNEDPFLFKLTDAVVEIMGIAYPELVRNREYISAVTKNEERRFHYTLEQGLRVLKEVIEGVKANSENMIPGDRLFKLYDTYGFPLDLTAEIAQEEGITLDEDGFHRAMEEQKRRARDAWVGAEEVVGPLYKNIATRHGETRFVGYERLQTEAEVLAIVKGDAEVKVAKEGEEIEIILNETSFYGEAGGQIGDRGVIIGEKGEAEVLDTKRPLPLLYLHIGKVRKGSINRGDRVLAQVDEMARASTMRNHTATHLLHACLKNSLGDHVKQAGSLVTPERLRFDFTHFSALSPDDRDRIEEMVNEKIRENIPVVIRTMPLEEALQTGAIALFGERYGEEVRVIQIGDVSKELCGGTHCKASGDIGFFKLLSEGSVAAGVRRIEAITGEEAYRYVKEREKELQQVALMLKATPQDLVYRVEKILAELKEKDREISGLKKRGSAAYAIDITAKVKEVKGIKVLSIRIDSKNPEELRIFADHLKDKLNSGILVIGSVKDDRVFLISMVTKDLTDRYSADKIIKEVAGIIGGRGGGSTEMAQAGGGDPEKLDKALEKVYQIIKREE